MQLLVETTQELSVRSTTSIQDGDTALRTVTELRRWFGREFALIDGRTADVCHCPAELRSCDWGAWGLLCRVVADRASIEVIADEGAFYVLAIPLVADDRSRHVAACLFAAKQVDEELLPCLEQLLGRDETFARRWANDFAPMPAEMALRIAARFRDAEQTAQRVRQLQSEVEDLSLNLSSTYEEISLLYRLTQNLKLSRKDEELARLAIKWLADVVPAESLAIVLTPTKSANHLDGEERRQPRLLTEGPCPLDARQMMRLVLHFSANKHLQGPMIVHGEALAAAGDLTNGLHDWICMPLCEGDNIFGYLAAFNHSEGGQFGSVEASLLGSVAAILGIHSGNIELYRQQREFLRGVVRALTSAIDAKDPYTCGHSDRVARLSVRLAEELGCDHETLNTIYLSGLLHDIGKIGIDDNVLRKPGRLTEVEYEHIKMHSEIGYRILRDLRQLDEVLPVVLHHHEQWDGKGYPQRLSGQNIPLMARIVAVADAFDAMGSDRPYRKGMPEERLYQVLDEGAGKQWDAAVVEALMRCKDDIRQIMQKDREPRQELTQWI
jgi:putative nucleotidyltransferase with HDIG domain